MAIQVFDPTPRESQAGQLGQALGTALGGYAGQQIQGIRQQNALENFKNSLTGTENPAQIRMLWEESFAGVPGGSKLRDALLPEVITQSFINPGQNPFQANYGQIQPAQGQIQQPLAQNANMAPQMALGTQAQSGNAPLAPQIPGQESAQGYPATAPSIPMQQTGGFAPGPMQYGGLDPRMVQLGRSLGLTPQQIYEYQMGIPQQQAAAKAQEIQLEKSNQLRNYAQERLPEGTSPYDLNQFVRIGQKYQNLSPEDWYAATDRDFKKYTNAINTLDKAIFPGKPIEGQGLFGQATSLIEGMFKSGKIREDAIKNLRDAVQPLKDLGMDEVARSKLAQFDLSPAEIEMVMRPLDDRSLLGIRKLTNAPYQEQEGFGRTFKRDFLGEKYYEDMVESNPRLMEQMTNEYSKFLQNNLKPGVSLLGLREYLRREKGLDWRQFQEALRDAQSNGLELDREQQAEIGSLSRAPMDSLAWIFQDWQTGLYDYLKGKRG